MNTIVSINSVRNGALIKIIDDIGKNDHRYVFEQGAKGEASLTFEFIEKDIKCTLEYLSGKKHLMNTRRINIMSKLSECSIGTEDHYYAYQALVKMRDRVKREVLAAA